jgi:hypothetical protein
MTRFEIGMTQPNPAWLQIIGQERVNCRAWDKTFSEETPRVMLVTHPLSDEEVPGFKAYIENGGAVLTDFPNLARLVHGFQYDKLETIHYIEPQTNPVFDGIGLVDLELPGYCSNQANTGRLDNQGAALYCGAVGKGYAIALPFDVGAALGDKRRALKAFYFESPELPYEEMAVVSHQFVRRLVVNCIRELCRQVAIPYAHLWYHPEFKRTSFAFRVDGDFASKEQIEKTHELATRHGLKFSWFVNTKAHRPLIGYFADLAAKGQDVQFHCFEHKVYDDLEHNLANVRSGLEIMNGAGLKPVGFAGPFGQWNESLNQALEQTGFKYSSEFGLVYDDLPSYPGLGEESSKIMQIPVHPMCFGRLLQAHMKHDSILKYFKEYFRVRYAGGEPLFIYDHPHRIVENYETFDAIFKIVDKASDVWQTTLTDFHDWWARRSELEFEIGGEPGIINVESEYDTDVAIHVVDRDQEALIPLMTRDFESDDLNWKPVKYVYPYKPEMTKTRKLGRHLWLREQMWKAGKLLKH